MTTHDEAIFDWWLDNAATDEELALSYDKQVETHILWLSGFNAETLLYQIPEGEMGEAH